MKRAVLYLVVAAFTALPATAFADSFAASYAGLGYAQTVTVNKGGTTYSVWAGQIRWNGPTGTFDEFISYCLDLTRPLESTQLFDVDSNTDAIPRWQEVAWLANQAVSSNAMGAGLQLAIWNLLYDTDYTVAYIAGAGFWSTTTSAAYYANEYLKALQEAGPVSGNAVFLNTAKGQDQVTTKRVPEPGTLLLLGAGAAVLAVRRRTRRQA